MIGLDYPRKFSTWAGSRRAAKKRKTVSRVVAG